MVAKKVKSDKAVVIGGGEEEIVARAREVSPPTRAINLPKLDIHSLRVTVIGDTELIVHAWSEKARRMMLSKHIGKPLPPRDKKSPVDDFVQSLYCIEAGKVIHDPEDHFLEKRSKDGHPDMRIEGGMYGVKALGFQNAMVEACTSTGKAITKVAARQAFRVEGDYFEGDIVRVFGDVRCREDMVRLNGQTADIRYRGSFPRWHAELNVKFNARVLTADQVINLLNIAGFSVGVCEWRPEKNGIFGMFHVATGDEMEALKS